MSLGSASSRFLIAFSRSVCPWVAILPYRRTKDESAKIQHYGPASETSRRDRDPRGRGGASEAAFDDEYHRRRGFLSVHPLCLPHFSRPLPEPQSYSGTRPSLEADAEVEVIKIKLPVDSIGIIHLDEGCDRYTPSGPMNRFGWPEIIDCQRYTRPPRRERFEMQPWNRSLELELRALHPCAAGRDSAASDVLGSLLSRSAIRRT
jgi:hypothetical protein